MGPNTPLLPEAIMPYNWLWGYLIPIGFLMLVWGGLAPRRARRLTPVAATAVALAVIGYWAAGFALHMGGAYPVTQDASLEALRAMLSLIPDNPGWGVVGLAGFFLSGDNITPAIIGLFLTYLPLIATAVVLVTVALAQTRRWIMILAGTLTGAVIVPVAACWMWGSGWLSHLGATLGLGSGFVDFGGSALILWLPGMIVLPVLLLQGHHPDSEEDPMPPTNYGPLVSNIGALLMGIGWLGWGLSRSFHVSGAAIDWYRAAMNVLLGMAGAVVTSQLYGWMATGRPEALLSSLGLGAGWGALLACAPFVPPWAALVVGLLAGLLFPLIHYVANKKLRSHGAATAVSLALTSGFPGVLGLAFLADGRWGQGWNGMGQGLSPEGAVVGPGVVGVFVAGNAQQLSAQLIGLLALALWGLLWGGIIGVIASPKLLGSTSYRARRAATGVRPSQIPATDEIHTDALPEPTPQSVVAEELTVDDGTPSVSNAPTVAGEAEETAALLPTNGES